MADTNFLRFFDKSGNDMNLGPKGYQVTSLYTGATSEKTYYEGEVFFPRVSVNLIESQQIFILQEITGPTSSFELRKVPGTAIVVSGNPTVSGIDSDFSILDVGEDVKIGNFTYTVVAVGGTGSFTVSPTPSISQTTQDIYYYDYLSYNQLRTSPGTFNEALNVSIVEEQSEFFIYDVNYTTEYPLIEKFQSSLYELENGSSDTLDPLTGRVSLPSVTTVPTQINLGFSSGSTATYDNIFQKTLNLTLEKSYQEDLVSAPIGTTSSITFEVGGTSHELYSTTKFYLQGVTASGATVTFYDNQLDVILVGVSGSNTQIVATNFISPVGSSNFSDYRILWKNEEKIADIKMYGETEAEDERFRLVLENFGKKIDTENEYIFRESDIDEDLTNFSILNQKRKELLLEGDNIYPYMGSYKALINIINFFGYYDLRIKEYFLNVDSDSSNFGKYMHVLVPKNEEQRNEVRKAWEIVPSSIYKKTSLFGLFYDLNRPTEEKDIYGIPEVEDAFDFSPEEVLIKLFGLKELLKKDYLPLNARIYDITGEGIYFERVRINSWADNLNHLVLDLGVKPQFKILPESETYITDLRRIDQFYIDKFVEQGLTGFIGSTALEPYLTAAGSSGPISDIYGTYIESYEFFAEEPYFSTVDTTWEYMPPGISNPGFNLIASRLTPLPDDENIVSGGPALLEAFFNISWEECDFTWNDVSVFGPAGTPVNINHWSWESLGRGEYIEMRWVVQKGGFNGFLYDSGRKSISDFLVLSEGVENFAVPAKLKIEMSEPLGPTSSIVSVSIIDPGFGYTSAPNVNVWSPGLGGTAAQISVTIDSNGYVDTATIVNPGSGYFFVPFVSVEPPSPVYNVDYRYLHAVALPFAGEYDVSLYLYDITNNFSVDFQKYTVKNWEVDFVSIFRKETPERTWKDFAVPVNDSSPRLVTWEEVTGPWYYPIHVQTSWGDMETSWESLNFSSYDGTSLFEYNFDTRILEINRDSNFVILENQLNELPYLNIGDFLFFSRESSDPVISNLKVSTDGVGSFLQGWDGFSVTNALVSGSSGLNYIETAPFDTTSYVTIGDELWLGEWYRVENIGATSIELDRTLNSSFTSVNAPLYPSSGEIQLTFTGASSVDLSTYSRILITEDADYSSMNPVNDFYVFVDGLTSSGSTITVKGDELSLKSAILKNSSLSENLDLYLSWGIFSGTYAIEITNISLTGSNTLFRLNDVNRELYYLDGNYSVRLADYDVDYAETRIGPRALTYENLNELTWDENDSLTWFGLEYHGGSLCGYVIPFVSPGGNITIDENTTFSFSGDSLIDSSKAGLLVASQELNASLNLGIIKYDYSVLPETELYIQGATGNLDVSSSVAVGATQIPLSGTPNFSIKIPALATASVTGGTVSGITIDNPGWGYTYLPSVTVSPPGGTGTPAELSCTLTGLPDQGQIATIVIDNPGSGYTSPPIVSIEVPTDFKPLDNYVWTGSEWLEIESINTNTLNLASEVNYPIPGGTFLLLPYQYHKQLFSDTSLFQQFYYFIHGKAKNPSSEMLSYVNFGNGVESEWAQHPERTYTYPLRNSFYFLSVPEYSNLNEDFLYNKWVYEGSDYPPLNVDLLYSSDTLSIESRIPFSSILQSSFSFIDTVVSNGQERVKQCTPVVFSSDKCRIPGKNSPVWTISNEDNGEIEVMSTEAKLMWNFTKTGNYTVSLEIVDSNGNVSIGQKNSFIVV